MPVFGMIVLYSFSWITLMGTPSNTSLSARKAEMVDSVERHDSLQVQLENEVSRRRNEESSFRWTVNGWEDSSQWTVSVKTTPVGAEAVHPIIWALLLLLAVVISLLYFSEPSEVNRLLADLDKFLKNPESKES